MSGDNNDTGESPSLFRRIDSIVRGIANGLTFGGADWFAGKMDTLFGGGTSEQNVAAERAETAQRQSEGYEEQAGEVVGALAGAGKVVRGAGVLLKSEKIIGAGAGMQLPLTAGAAGIRTTFRAALWAKRISFKTVKWASIVGGISWGTAEGLDYLNSNWASNHNGEQPSAALQLAAKAAGLLWNEEEGVGGWVWNNAIVPTASAVGGFAQAWAAEPTYTQAPTHPQTSSPNDDTNKQSLQTPTRTQNTPPTADTSSSSVAPSHQEATQDEVLAHAQKGEALFQFDSAMLDASEGEALKTYAHKVLHQVQEARRNHAHLEFANGQVFDGGREDSQVSFEVDGHVDPVGGASRRNRDLANLRAGAVKSLYEQAAKEEGVKGIVNFTSVGAGVPRTSEGSQDWQQRNSSAQGFEIKPSQ